MENRPNGNSGTQDLDLVMQQNVIREGLIGPAPFILSDPFLRPKAIGTEALAEVMRTSPIDTSE